MTRDNWVATCTIAMMALAVTAVVAKQPVQGNSQGRGRSQAEAHMRFDDHDRQVTRTWYESQRNMPMGFRSGDRLSPTIELQFHEGFVIDRTLRGRVHSVPSALLRLLTPAPRSYRYVAIDGHIVLTDNNYRVFDVIHVGHDR